MSTTCLIHYRCTVCEVTRSLEVDLMRLDAKRPLSEQLYDIVSAFHCKGWRPCGAAELVCADTDSQLRDVRFVFLPLCQGYSLKKYRERLISEALAEMDWERDGQYQAERIIASAR